MFRLTQIALALSLTVTAGMAQALPPLGDNPRVRAEFLSAAVGDEIRKNCPTISARFFRVMARAKELEDYALSLGYTKDDITRMRKDPANKAELKRLRDTYLAQNGVTPGDAESYCRLGLAEIEKNSLTGWLLRAN
ncbi:DUF5333 domain-containing protein [Psychromarinibacter sp. C21-152]|uniref:DUF5333 domain-containing protein n=1 Tax=Psychromarinibacter sediminicola TaxID=3033385 RepID=A0AAE3NNJ2_9RHOB|nr:DUF5333 domain-containing protein [Psychromarinibacter sediminicola]MDF0599231.1 DUF5333 domain-containing protein [Psychromarinibacter sediminicola]